MPIIWFLLSYLSLRHVIVMHEFQHLGEFLFFGGVGVVDGLKVKDECDRGDSLE